MEKDDLKTYSQLGRALWASPEKSDPISAETLSAVSLLPLSEDRKIERAAQALLYRAVQLGSASLTESNLASIADPFFRLEPRQRFILIALHQGRWSYARLGRILAVSPQEFEQECWSARLTMAQGLSKVNYPAGSKMGGFSCPEYHSDRPWTQKFLDDEFDTSRERIFLQNHLMACDPCREALQRCRTFYYALEELLPKNPTNDRLINSLQMILEKDVKPPSLGGQSYGRIFFEFIRARRDVQIILGGLLIFILFKFLHG